MNYRLIRDMTGREVIDHMNEEHGCDYSQQDRVDGNLKFTEVVVRHEADHDQNDPMDHSHTFRKL